jgi:hypothetical protein
MFLCIILFNDKVNYAAEIVIYIGCLSIIGMVMMNHLANTKQKK